MIIPLSSSFISSSYDLLPHSIYKLLTPFALPVASLFNLIAYSILFISFLNTPFSTNACWAFNVPSLSKLAFNIPFGESSKIFIFSLNILLFNLPDNTDSFKNIFLL